MTKFQENISRYIIFWETKTEVLPDKLEHKLPIFAIILRMVESDSSVELLGRCKGIIKDDKHYYNGFLLFKYNGKENIEEFCKRYEQYIRITGKHKYKTIKEMRECLSSWGGA